MIIAYMQKYMHLLWMSFTIAHVCYGAEIVNGREVELRKNALNLYQEINAIKREKLTTESKIELAKRLRELRENCDRWGVGEMRLNLEKGEQDKIERKIKDLNFNGELLLIELYEGNGVVVTIREKSKSTNLLMVCYLLKIESEWEYIHSKGVM